MSKSVGEVQKDLLKAFSKEPKLKPYRQRLAVAVVDPKCTPQKKEEYVGSAVEDAVGVAKKMLHKLKLESPRLGYPDSLPNEQFEAVGKSFLKQAILELVTDRLMEMNLAQLQPENIRKKDSQNVVDLHCSSLLLGVPRDYWPPEEHIRKSIKKRFDSESKASQGETQPEKQVSPKAPMEEEKPKIRSATQVRFSKTVTVHYVDPDTRRPLYGNKSFVESITNPNLLGPSDKTTPPRP